MRLLTTTTKTYRRNLRHKRCRNKIQGTADMPRMTVFISNKHAYAQIIDDVSGKTLCAGSTLDKDLRDKVQGKSMSETAGILGQAIGEKAKAAGIETIVFDRSGYQYGKRLKSLCDAARKAGLKF